MTTRPTRRYFAVVHPRELTGYALDYYPNERKPYLEELGDAIIGDHATQEDARKVVRAAIELRMKAKEQKT